VVAEAFAAIDRLPDTLFQPYGIAPENLADEASYQQAKGKSEYHHQPERMQEESSHGPTREPCNPSSESSIRARSVMLRL
jgi:hypothetical protein